MTYSIIAPIICIAIFLHRYLRKQEISIANPSNIAAVGWLFPFSLTSLLTLSPYYDEWRPGLYLFLWVIVAYLLFICGNIIGYSAIKAKNFNLNRRSFRDQKEISMQTFRNQAYFIFILGFIGYINNLKNIINAGGISIYIDLGLREAELTFGSNTLMNYLYFLNILTLLMFVYLRYIQQESRKSDLLVIIIAFIALLSHGVKGTIVWPLVMVFVLIHMRKKSIIWSIVWPALITVTVIFLIVTLGRELPSLTDGTSNFDDWLAKGFLNFPLYFSTGFVNFEIELEKFTHFAFGLNTFAPFYEVFSFLLGNRQSPDITAASDELLYYHGYNTATYLRDPFRDFGLVGLILFPLLYGLTTSLLFAFASQSKNPYAIISYSIYAAAIFGMFFSNHFQKIQYIFLIFICLFLSILNTSRNKTHRLRKLK